MSVTGFNQRRRELAARAAVKKNKPLEEMTYQELRALAKERSVEDYYKMNTEELREALSVEDQGPSEGGV